MKRKDMTIATLLLLIANVTLAGEAQTDRERPNLHSPSTDAKDHQPVVVTLAMNEPGFLDASYSIPASCKSLSFLNADFQESTIASLRKDWVTGNECTEISDNGIRRKNALCTNLQLRIPATTRRLDRVYPWAYPFEKGFYVHTSAYTVNNTCGEIQWKFKVTDGTVIVDGIPQSGNDESVPHKNGVAFPVIFLQETFNPDVRKRLYIDTRLSLQTNQFLVDTTSDIDRLFRGLFPELSFTFPYILATPSPSTFTWGDVANKTTMRLSLPPNVSAEQKKYLQGFIAHEMAHMTQPRFDKDVWKNEQATLSEGGAEFLRLIALFKRGWITATMFGSELEHSINSCLLATEGRSWESMENHGFGRTPYQCGLTFYAMGLSMNASQSRPLTRLQSYYKKGILGERTDFATAIECGDISGCSSRWLNKISENRPLSDVLTEYASQPDSIIKAVSTWNAPIAELIAYRHVGQLMQADCGGSISMYRDKEAARIASGPACKVLREGMTVVEAEGLPLFVNSDAVKASVQACHSRGDTELGLKDGSRLTITCGKSVNLPANMFAVDPEKLSLLLK